MTTTDRSHERVGMVVDRYTIVRLLGKGGMGTVYEARHATLARRFAIKFLLPALAADPEALRRFENEAKAAGGLEHPNLIAVTDLGRASDGAPYLVMEFLEGEDCAKLLARLGPLPVARAVDIVLQACRGLVIAHRAGIVHRDLKPENLFVCDAGDGSDRVKVLDFGIAKLRRTDAGVTTGTGTTFGTAHYMSPEQARGAADVDQRADVWSLGVVLYELLTGGRPFEGEQFLHVIHEILTIEPRPLGELRPELPPGLGVAVARALTKDVAQRASAVSTWAELLAPFAKPRFSSNEPRWSRTPGPPSAGAAPLAPTEATPPTLAGAAQESRGRRATSRRSTRWWGWGLGLTGALLAGAIGVGTAWQRRDARPGAPPQAGTTAPAVHESAPPPAPPVPPTAAAPPPPAVPAPAPPSRLGPNASEQGFARSDKSKTPIRRRRRASSEAPAPAPKPAIPAEPADSPARPRPIDIEKTNPYGP